MRSKIVTAILVAGFAFTVLMVGASPGTAVVRPGTCGSTILPRPQPIVPPPPIHTGLAH